MVNIHPASMIASLSGPVTDLGIDYVIIECSGVGYCVNVTVGTAQHCTIGQEITLHTSLMVREDSMTLYGFYDRDERIFFQQLQTVSGVGPRLALTILSTLTMEEISHALSNSDIAALTQVPGVGKRGAQRLIVELKDKILPTTSPGKRTGAATSVPSVHSSHKYEDVIVALAGLGFAIPQATETIDSIISEYPDDHTWDTAVLIKQALSRLGKQR